MRALPWILVFGLFSALIVMCGWGGVAQAKADMYREMADSAAGVSAAALARADSAAVEVVRLRAVYADSLARWEAERAEAVRARRRAAEAASVARETLVASLDSAEAEAFAAYSAARDSTDAANASTIATLESERAALTVEVGLLGAEVTALRDALGAAGVANEMYRAANAGLQRALRAERMQGNVLKLAGAALLGLAVYDRVAS